MEYKCGSFKRIVVLPLSLFLFLFPFFLFFIFFWWPQWLFLFKSHLSSLGSFDFVLFGIFFLTLGATLYILQEYRRSFTPIMMQMYASARIEGYAMILARNVAM